MRVRRRSHADANERNRHPSERRFRFMRPPPRFGRLVFAFIRLAFAPQRFAPTFRQPALALWSISEKPVQKPLTFPPFLTKRTLARRGSPNGRRVAANSNNLVKEGRFHVTHFDRRRMHGALARQVHARAQRRNHMGVSPLIEHDGSRAARLPVHGNAHLLALAAIGNRAVDIEYRHEHERRLMLFTLRDHWRMLVLLKPNALSASLPAIE